MVGEKYLTALTDGAQCMPVVIPVLVEHIEIDELLAKLDGIFLTGSPSNVEPHHYAGDVPESGTLHDPHRDAVTLPLARRALELSIPLLAVCRGFQELNVALGGTLHQDVAAVPGYHDHSENPDDSVEVQYGPAHPVTLVEGGLLRSLHDEETVIVNSLHNQGVRKLATDVTVAALADDGLVEAFTVDNVGAFALAVQWHPEWQVTANEFSMKIFRAFGEACSQRAAVREP